MTWSVAGTDTIMQRVLIALLPGTLLSMLLLGMDVLRLMVISVATALIAESVSMLLRKRPLQPALTDGSAVVSGCLLALCLPPGLPAWQIVTGAAVMILIGKQAFGGLGNNPFNPAMVAFAFMLIAFPVTMTDWGSLAERPPVDTTSAAKTTTVAPIEVRGETWDAVSAATPLDRRVERHADEFPDENGSISADGVADTREDPTTQSTRILGSVWPWINLGWLLGGLVLLGLKSVDWRLPSGFLAGVFAMHILTGFAQHSPPGFASLFALPLSGAILFAAFFIVTDPVTAPVGPRGRWCFAISIGCLTVLIREFSAYPEGVAFAVLLMNACVPLIDHLDVGAGHR